LYSKKRENVIIRQINNPLGGLDYNLLSFAGYGIKRKKTFGFVGCNRIKKMAEGKLVLKELKTSHGYEYAISNIEYVDLEKWHLEKTNHAKSIANTNILFANLKGIEKTLEKDPFPGKILNQKNRCEENGKILKAGRLELTMQSISDSIITIKKKKEGLVNLKTFVIFKERNKIFSSIFSK